MDDTKQARNIISARERFRVIIQRLEQYIHSLVEVILHPAIFTEHLLSMYLGLCKVLVLFVVVVIPVLKRLRIYWGQHMLKRKTQNSLHNGLNHIWKEKPLLPWDEITGRLSWGWWGQGNLSENMTFKLRTSWSGKKWRKMKASRGSHVASGSEAGKSV